MKKTAHSEQPIVPWDADENFNDERVVWWSRVDNRYLVEVRRTVLYKAELYIFDHTSNDKQLACFEVPLAYNAMFGPDVSDVAEWQSKVIKFIDQRKDKPRSRGETKKGK